MIGIAVGSTCGVLILIAMLVMLIATTLCLMMKKRKERLFDFSTNVAYSKRNMPKEANNTIVTEENTAYESTLTLSMANKVDVEYESFHDSTSTESNSETKRSKSSRADSLVLTTHNNIAYQPTAMISNIAYGSFHKII